jgi:hypothetical protein
MLPKKGRKSITVNGVLYHYIVSGSVSVVIRNSVTGALIKWHEEWKEKWKKQLKPSDIEQIIKDSK